MLPSESTFLTHTSELPLNSVGAMARFVYHLCVLMAWVAVTTEGAAAREDPSVSPPCGPLIGKHMKLPNGREITAFKGVPYGKPPVGKLRFMSPQAAESWTEPRKAHKDSPRCVQPLLINYSEDCLYLNIYTPNLNPTKPLAVLVYIYGGYFSFGGTKDYGPDYLLEDSNVILVVPNTRGGFFGYLSFGDDVVSGNMGLKDYRLALQWIQQNIHSFGGDPSKVTIWGVSSGAVIVHDFMMYAANQGLFRAGITNSGTALMAFGFKPPKEVAKMKYSVAQLSGCPEESKELLACLQDKTPLQILKLYEISYRKNSVPGVRTFLGPLGPVMEPDCVVDRFVNSNPWHARVNVPWLGGVSKKEATFLFSPAIDDRTNRLMRRYERQFDEYFPLLMNYQNSVANGSKAVQAARDYYMQGKAINRSTLQGAIDLLSDAYFVYGHYEAVKRSNTSKVFYYLLDHMMKQWTVPILKSGKTGANHADELYCFWPHPGLPFQLPSINKMSKIDKVFSKTMVKMWTDFAIHLTPTPDNSLGVKWEPFSYDESYLHIKQEGMSMEKVFRPEEMNFWKSTPYPIREDGDFKNLSCQGLHFLPPSIN